MRAWAGGFALLAPGLDGWEASRDVLAGRRPHEPGLPFAPPAPDSLPPNERRRASAAVRLAIAAAGGALAAAGLTGEPPESVFASSNGDGAVVSAILEALARSPRLVSPTQFHNSVHNAAAAYWAIGARCMAASTSLGCHDDGFAAALLQAAAKVATRRRPVLLCAYDVALPFPLDAVRPTGGPFAAAMVLTPGAVPASRAALEVRFAPGPPEGRTEPLGPALAALYRTNPAARSLALLEAVARGEATRLLLAHTGGDSHLAVDVTPC